MKAIYAILFLVPMFIISCAKKESGPTVIEGRILEEGSNRGISGAAVTLMQDNRSWGGSALQIKGLQQVHTNSDGYYKITFDAEEATRYGIRADAEKYVYRSGIESFTAGGKVIKDIYLIPFAYLKIHLKTVTDAYYVNVGGNCEIPSIRGTTDTLVFCETNGNTINKVGYWVGNQRDTLHFYKDVYCPGHDTTLIEIFY